MRILRFIPYFSREFGGPVNHAQYLTKELNDRGYEHTIYTTNLANRSGERMSFADSEFNVRAFRAIRLAGDYFLTPEMVSAVRAESDFDLIHAHCYRNFQCDLAAGLARLTDTPLVLTAHGTIKSIDRRDALLKGFHDVGTLKSGLRWADRCIAVAEAEIEQYTAKGVPEAKVEVIHHGVDVDRFTPEVDGASFLDEYGLEGSQVVLYAGRLHERKGLQYLIPAVDELADEQPDVELVIAGPDYGFEEELRELCVERGCGDRVHFVGHLDQDTLIKAYNAAYLVCYPSKFEIFGHTLTEASACGTPCVAMGWGAAQQIVQDGETGRLLDEYGDIEQLVAVLGELLSSPDAVDRYSAQAREHILDNFSWAACASAHEDLYQAATE
jgi:glycosyltransferase involved in cell wall biosynthesis